MTDLAKALERVRAHGIGMHRLGSEDLAGNIRTVCDAAERVSQVSVEDVEKAIGDTINIAPNDTKAVASISDTALAVMALLRVEG